MVRINERLLLHSGRQIEAGTILTVVREVDTTAGKRLCLADETGVVLPYVAREDVTWIP